MSGVSPLNTPYKGLMPYEEEDAQFFFGRERERDVIAANLSASRLTVVYGSSGVGKSSVLRAGVVHHLGAIARQKLERRGNPEVATAVLSSWRDDPIPSLLAQAQKAIAAAFNRQSLEPMQPSGSLADTLQAMTKAAGIHLFIILDQFEEYFLYHEQDDGEGTFAFEFPRAVNRLGLPVSFLISIREDAVTKLDRFKVRIPNLLDNRLEVKHLNREAARAAIEKPIEQYNRLNAAQASIIPEPKLVEEVLKQVETGQIVIGEAGRGAVKTEAAGLKIETPYLQLVMSRLWEEEMRLHSPVLRVATLDRLKGAKGIVRTHLDATMRALSPDEQDLAADIFLHLVTPSGTKIAHIASDLARMAHVNEAQLLSLVEKLSFGDKRILRAVAPPPDRPDTPRYEIFHDVLAPAILDWRTRHLQTRQRAEADRRSEEERLRAEEKARAETQARANNVLRRWIWALAFMTIFATVAWVVAYTQYRKANASEQKARAAEAVAVQVLRLYDDVIPVFDGLLYGINNVDRGETLARLSSSLDAYTANDDRKGQAVTHAKIGDFHALLGENAEAQKSYEAALPILEDLLGRDHLYVAKILHNLAKTYVNQGNQPSYGKAEEQYERALRILERVRGLENTETVTARNNLALNYQRQGKYALAESIFKQALDIDTKLGADVAIDNSNLALAYYKQGKYAEAQSHFEQALAIWKGKLGDDNTTVANCLSNLADTYRKQRKLAEAEELARKSLEIWERNVSLPDDNNLVPSLNILGMIYSDQGRFSDAERRLSRALAIREKTLGPAHEKLAISINALAVLSYRQGKYEEAEKLFRRALEIRETALGQYHPDMIEILEGYATLLRAIGREADAVGLEFRAKATQTKNAEGQ